MKFPRAQTFAVCGRAAFAIAFLVAACAAPAWAQRGQKQMAPPAAVKPPAPPTPVRTAPPPALPAVIPIPSGASGLHVPPVRPIVLAPIPRAGAPFRVAEPLTIAPFAAPAGLPIGGVFAGKLPGEGQPTIGRAGSAPVQFPPPTRRLLPGPPPVPQLAATPIPAVPLASQLPRENGLPPLPPGAKLYCSPWSALYNTGSICFNPDFETINPDFYPWGLFSRPAFVNAPGFVPPFPPGLLVRLCPKCAAESAGLIPSPSPLDRWRQTTSGMTGGLDGFPRMEISARLVAPKPAPSSAIESSGPPIILVLSDGARELVSRYWLGQDWLLHFITVTGSRQAIPLNRLNLKATGAANYERGVSFVMPAWPEPQQTN